MFSLKEVIELRYRKDRQNNFLTIIKIALSLLFTVVISFSFLKIYGNTIAKSACDFISKDIGLTELSSTDSAANYENDFLTFLGSQENENDKEALVTDTNLKNESAIAVNLSALSGKYKNYNGTSVINNTDYPITDLLYSDYKKPSIDKNQPAILIYHTHTSEGYHGGGSVVDIGKVMKEEFEKLGYKTIHITESYDKEKFSGSYSRSVKGIEKAIEEYPTIQLIFDIHRDAITSENGNTYLPLTTIEGKNCAQVMFVCGTDEKGLSHPDWRENFKFALDVSRTMGKNYGLLSRPVNLRGDRFNTHKTNYSFLMEIGSSANTLEEAKIAAVYTVNSLVQTIENK